MDFKSGRQNSLSIDLSVSFRTINESYMYSRSISNASLLTGLNKMQYFVSPRIFLSFTICRHFTMTGKRLYDDHLAGFSQKNDGPK